MILNVLYVDPLKRLKVMKRNIIEEMERKSTDGLPPEQLEKLSRKDTVVRETANAL